MRSHLRMILPIVLSLATMTAVPAQDAPAQSATYLGDTPYSLNMNGTLRDVCQALTKLTGWYINLYGGGRVDGVPVKPLDGDIPVAINLEKAKLHEILLAICKQAHATYDTQPQGRYLSLRAGDPNLDVRPTTTVEGYTIRVGSVVTEFRATRRFRWGEPLAEAGDYQDQLRVELQVNASSTEADRKLAGIDEVKAVTEKGDALGPLRAGNRPMIPRYMYGQERVGFTGQASLAVPPEGTTKLTRLEGELILYSSVKTTDFTLTPASKGLPFAEDDITGMLTDWQQSPDNLRVSVQVKYVNLRRPNEGGPMMGPGGNADRRELVLIDKAGKEVGMPMGNSTNTAPDGAWKLDFRFGMRSNYTGEPLAAADIDHAQLRIVRYGPADKHLPFVIENIPLP